MLRIYLLGLLFGIALTMGEVISWFRIQEMFYFAAFHMFGVIGSSIVFGMGWAITGACPGPLFITLGAGYLPVIVAILGALMGTFLYGIIMKHLPH